MHLPLPLSPPLPLPAPHPPTRKLSVAKSLTISHAMCLGFGMCGSPIAPLAICVHLQWPPSSALLCFLDCFRNPLLVLMQHAPVELNIVVWFSWFCLFSQFSFVSWVSFSWVGQFSRRFALRKKRTQRRNLTHQLPCWRKPVGASLGTSDE